MYPPFAVQHIPAWLNSDTAVCFFIWHHHVWLTCIVTVGIWNPNVLYITPFYGKGAVEFSRQTSIRPFLSEVCIHPVFLLVTSEVTIAKQDSNYLSKIDSGVKYAAIGLISHYFFYFKLSHKFQGKRAVRIRLLKSIPKVVTDWPRFFEG